MPVYNRDVFNVLNILGKIYLHSTKTLSSRLSAWLFWPQCESTATTGVPNPSPRRWSRVTHTPSSPSASSSMHVHSRSTATGWRRDKLRTERHFSRTLPKPSCCRWRQRSTSRSTTSGNEHLRTHLLELHGITWLFFFFFLHWLKALLIKHNPVQQDKADFGLFIADSSGILKHSIGYNSGTDLPQKAASVATVSLFTPCCLSCVYIIRF